MRIYRTSQAVVVEDGGKFYRVEAESWDELVRGGDLAGRARAATQGEAVKFRAGGGAGADWQSGGVGGRSNVLPQPGRADARVKGCGRRGFLRARV